MNNLYNDLSIYSHILRPKQTHTPETDKWTTDTKTDGHTQSKIKIKRATQTKPRTEPGGQRQTPTQITTDRLPGRHVTPLSSALSAHPMIVSAGLSTPPRHLSAPPVPSTPGNCVLSKIPRSHRLLDVVMSTILFFLIIHIKEHRLVPAFKTISQGEFCGHEVSCGSRGQ